MVKGIKFALKVAGSVIASQAFLGVLHALDIYPDLMAAKIVTRMLAPDPLVVRAIYWSLSGLLTIAVFFALELVPRFFRASPLEPATTASATPAVAAPRLRLHYSSTDPNCFGEYYPSGGMFSHVFVHNLSKVAIHNCRVDVEKIIAVDFDGNPIPIIFHVRLPLSNCTVHEVNDPKKYQPFTLPPETRTDAVEAVSGDLLGGMGKDQLRVHFEPKHNRGLYRKPGIYRFLLHLHSDTDSTKAWLVVRWTGMAREINVQLEQVS